MAKDVIALTPRMPDVKSLLAGLYAGGPELRMGSAAGGAVVCLCAPDGSPLVSVEAPLLIRVPGEVARLLGAGTAVPEGPVWWTEAHAASAPPEAGRLAAAFAGRLTTVLGGTIWPPQEATTELVPFPSASATPDAPDDTLPGVDILTGTTAVVLADRPVIAMSAWLSDTLRTVTTAGRALHILTPSHVRLTLPARTALRGAPNRWVVQDDRSGGYYDGLSGEVLRWHGGTFSPARDDAGRPLAAESFAPANADNGERQLALSLRTVHEAGEQLTLGHALEAAWRHLTGAPPAGWSTAEPVNLPWSPRQLTELARMRAPAPTWLVAVGHPNRPAIATFRVSRTTAGVEEEITLALGYGPDETPALDALEPLAHALATDHGLTTMLVTLRSGRRDLTVPPRFEAPPSPVSFTLGPAGVRSAGLGHALRPPQGPRPVRLGTATRPALHYPLDDGTGPGTWAGLRTLGRHLKDGRRTTA